jgi:hypothetical protein
MSIVSWLGVTLDSNYYPPSADSNVENNESWISIKGSTVRLMVRRTITNSNDSGLNGEVCFDSEYIYFCVATDTWVRAALSTW